jgi:hypothetical protein
MAYEKLRLFCPKCLDALKLDSVKLKPDSTVACDSCKAVLKAGDLSTSTGHSFTRYALEHARADITFSGSSLWGSLPRQIRRA